MDVNLGIAGAICIALGFGHQTIGVVWVLPHITEDSLPRTPFGASRMTVAMVRVTWYIVTIFVFSVGGLLFTLAADGSLDARDNVLRWLAVMWAAAAVMALWVARPALRNPSGVLRLPVPLFWVIVAVLCWRASG